MHKTFRQGGKRTVRFADDRETQIIAAAAKGDVAAMRSLYDRHIGYLTAVCSRYITDSEDVRDILQDSMVKILSSIRNFDYRGSGSLRAWMTRIVVNESLKHLRKDRISGAKEATELDIPYTETEEEDPKTDDIPASELQKMIRNLPEKYRTVFNLYIFQEYSHREISRMLDISEGTSASCLHRAKKMLIDMINEYRKYAR